MQETSKCRKIRESNGDFNKYLRGSGIDIGAGDDPLVIPNGIVTPWDKNSGDAEVMSGVSDNSYDFVYSSHCLEHMRSVPRALQNWARILRPDGFLYIVIPDYILYEKMRWPSLFNPDHKQSFSPIITRDMTGRENHHHLEQDLAPILNSLAFRIIERRVEDYGFDYNKGVEDQTLGEATAQLCLIAQKNVRRPTSNI
ncbi:MAG: class I SAM-dependent methyltransferase [bacterium]|nr:class I SAM-dependent methyltransferase [bacterium]